MSGITMQAEGARVYAIGNTYPIRDRLRSLGAHWDGDRKAWWIGAAKRSDLEAMLAATPAQSAERTPAPQSDSAGSDTEVRAKAQYKGRTYYVIWEGETKRGRAAKLCFRDGSKVFWADAGAVQIVKRYGRENFRSGRTEYPTIGSLQRFAEEMRSGKRNDLGHRDGQRYECEECGEYVTAGEGSCWETGAAH